MITINNLENILSINSQDIEIDSCNELNVDYYRFVFFHKDINSAHFSVHMARHPNRNDKNSFTMKLWDGINSTPLEYGFGLKDVKDPFALLKYLNDVVYDWDIITNK